MNSEVQLWLARARSNLAFGKSLDDEDLLIYGGEIFFEEPCYELHQSTEKSFKALLIHRKIKFPKSHNIAELIDLLESDSVNVPDEIKRTVRLTRYAVKTKYPDEFVKVTKEEYEEAIKLAELAYKWVLEQVK